MKFLAAAILMMVQEPSTVTVLGVGNQSCGAWTDAKSERTIQHSLKRTEFLGWLLGYLSAFNATPEYRDIAVASEARGFVVWVDRYCEENPLDTVYYASASLVNELIRREEDR